MRTNDRDTAADFLRQARQATGTVAAEAVAWARCACPESFAALRLEIRLCLQHGDTHLADTLIAQGLLLRPNAPHLLTLLARRLAARGRLDAAVNAIRRALIVRPEHCGTLAVAADLATRLGNHDLAAGHLGRILERRPAEDAVRDQLVMAQLHAGRIDDAAFTLRLFRRASAVLRARVLRAQDRLCDAAAILEECCASGDPDEDTLLELVDLLDQIGDVARLRLWINRIEIRHPRAYARACIIRLSLGEFRTAFTLMRQLALVRTHRPEALAVMAAAAWAEDRVRLARGLFIRFRAETTDFGETQMAEVWRRTISGKLLADHANARKAGADPVSSPLARLLEGAKVVFESRLRRHPDDVECVRQIEICRDALGLTGPPRAFAEPMPSATGQGTPISQAA